MPKSSCERAHGGDLIRKELTTKAHVKERMAESTRQRADAEELNGLKLKFKEPGPKLEFKEPSPKLECNEPGPKLEFKEPSPK